jgi:hypothetical protein
VAIQIIIACMALYNFIRENVMSNDDFSLCDHDEFYKPTSGIMMNSTSLHLEQQVHNKIETLHLIWTKIEI